MDARSRFHQLLITRKVIGDVLDMFTPTPTIDFSVHYNFIQLFNDCHIKPSWAIDRPRVLISGDRRSTNLYTLVMTDPDAPSPLEHTLRECLLWMVINIPEGLDATKGKEVVSYVGPNPPIGTHRYVFTLFQQQALMMVLQCPVPFTRPNFRTRTFAIENKLGLPVAALFFNAQMEQPINKHRLTLQSTSR